MAEPHRGIAGVTIAVCVLALIFFAEGTVLATKIAFDLGVPGTYVLGEDPRCSDTRADRCSSITGTFTSDDGAVTYRDVRLDGVLRAGFAKGGSVRAFDVGTPKTVYSPETRHGFPAPLHLGLSGLGLLVIGLASLYLWWHRDRD